MSLFKWLELRVPPVISMLVTALLISMVASASGQTDLHPALRITLGLVPTLAGAVILILGVRAFGLYQTTVDPLTPNASSNLVTTGIYRYTRNPMYLGMALCLMGWTIFLGSVVALLLIPGFTGFITWFQIRPEERFLREKFGSEYITYSKNVRRWL